MQLLDLAVMEFKISPTNQPATKIIADWFYDKLEKMQGERYLSMAKAKMLATFVREPEAQRGGLKKLKTVSLIQTLAIIHLNKKFQQYFLQSIIPTWIISFERF